jgi:Domain of unknown function (DUF5658)
MKLLIPLLLALEAADGILTYSAVGKGLVREANPVMQTFAGTDNFLLMKISGAILCAVLLGLTFRRFPRVSLIATLSILMIYAVVFTWNLSILL